MQQFLIKDNNGYVLCFGQEIWDFEIAMLL
jgi:hypothetical protein